MRPHVVMNKFLIKVVVVSIYLTCISTVIFAQPGDPQSDPDNAVPIPGIAYLIAGGLAIGIKKIIGNKNKQNG